LISQVRVLVVTVTDIETDSLHAQLQPLPGQPGLLRVLSLSHTYTVGRLGCYPVAHVRAMMGSTARDASTLSVKEALREWPRTAAVIAVGIAFGRGPEGQKFGDVLVSHTVQPYEPARVGDGAPIPRGIALQAGRTLLDRFRNRPAWEHSLPDGSLAAVHIGQILSGEKLVANRAFRDQLFSVYPEARGGEMEASGVGAACDSERVEWIVVKGIADWADPAKDSAAQEYASQAAVSLCVQVLSDPRRLNALGIQGCSEGM
jgi:nucleoside phosphorylase